MFLLVGSFMFAQFNTLMPAQPQKPESQIHIEATKEEYPPEQKNGKKSKNDRNCKTVVR